MDRINSRRNPIIAHMRKLGNERAYRRETGRYFCEGEKLLREAVACGAEISTVLSCDEIYAELSPETEVFAVSKELIEYISPLKNTRGPVFAVRIKSEADVEKCRRVIILDNVQDPGNVGAIIRSANAFSLDAVILTGACADPYNPKTVRSAMGALFRQPVLELTLEQTQDFALSRGLKLFGAELAWDAEDVRDVKGDNIAVIIGNEGSGIDERMRPVLEGKLRIPINPACESLNAAVAASIIMWELTR